MTILPESTLIDFKFQFLGIDVALDGPFVEGNSVVFYCNASVTTGTSASDSFKVHI